MNLQTNMREEWLINATELSKNVFKQVGYSIPENIKLSCSYPSNGKGGKKKKPVGQCIDTSASAENNYNILIHPEISDKIEVLGILTHELVHATVGIKEGHNKVFKQCATSVGLEGKMTATTTGEKFDNLFSDVIKELPDYPHGSIILSDNDKKQTTRMLKLTCENETGLILRMSKGAYDKFGSPLCGCCNIPMVLNEKGV